MRWISQLVAALCGFASACGSTTESLPASPEAITLLGAGAGRRISLSSLDERLAVSATHGHSDDPLVAVVAGSWVVATGPGQTWVHWVSDEGIADVRVVVDEALSVFGSLVLEDAPGPGAGFGRDAFPGVVLGPPDGGGMHAGGIDVASLGLGGHVTVGFSNVFGYDGPGADFIVFENAFVDLASGQVFAEPGIVSVSGGDEAWSEYHCEENAAPYVGCAGVAPVLAGTLAVPSNVQEAGGDAFDLDDVLPQIDRVRIRDSGTTLDTGITSGFDLDAVALIHALPSDVAAIEVEGPRALSVFVGGTIRLPSVTAVRPIAEPVLGVAAKWSVISGAGVRIEAETMVGLAAGTAELSARVGPFETTINVEVVK